MSQSKFIALCKKKSFFTLPNIKYQNTLLNIATFKLQLIVLTIYSPDVLPGLGIAINSLKVITCGTIRTHPWSLPTGISTNQAYLISRWLLKVTVLTFLRTVNGMTECTRISPRLYVRNNLTFKHFLKTKKRIRSLKFDRVFEWEKICGVITTTLLKEKRHLLQSNHLCSTGKKRKTYHKNHECLFAAFKSQRFSLLSAYLLIQT